MIFTDNREEAALLGARLRVEGRVDFICKSDAGKVAVKMIEGKDHWPHAWFEVTLAEHPEVKFMKQDTPLVVEGVFNGFQYGDFRLKDGRIIDYETPTNESNATSG